MTNWRHEAEQGRLVAPEPFLTALSEIEWLRSQIVEKEKMIDYLAHIFAKQRCATQYRPVEEDPELFKRYENEVREFAKYYAKGLPLDEMGG